MARATLVALAIAVSLVGCSGGDDRAGRAGLTAPATPAAEGTERPRVYLAGDGELAVVDVETGDVERRRLDELLPGDPPYRIARRGEHLVFYGRDTYAVDLELSDARRLQRSWFFIPSAHEERVWVALLDPESPETVRALSGVAEVTSEGVVTLPPVRPPGGRWPVAATTAGLLFERRGGGLDLWDPESGELVRRLPRAWRGPTHGNLLAWSDGDGPAWGGTLHLTDVASGSELWRTDPPAGFAVYEGWSGAFSPAGDLLAVPVARSRDQASRRALALVDVQTGTAWAVPGSAVPPGYVLVAWSSSGEGVFVTGGNGNSRTLVVYRPGAERARRLTVDVPFYGIAAS